MNLTEEEVKAIEKAGKEYSNNIYKMIYSEDDLLKQRSAEDFIAGATQERIKAKVLETGLEMIAKHSTNPYAQDRANRAIRSKEEIINKAFLAMKGHSIDAQRRKIFSDAMEEYANQKAKALEVDLKTTNEFLATAIANLTLERIKVKALIDDWLASLQVNYQAQIAGFYNDDKTDEERKIRLAVIQEYEDLIAIFKSRVNQYNNKPH